MSPTLPWSHVPLALVLLSLLLAGCVVEIEEDLPRLRLEPSDDQVPMNGRLDVEVRFVNSGEEPFVVETSRGCIEVKAWVYVDDLALELPGRADAPCPGGARSLEVPVGEGLSWGPFRFEPEAYERTGEPVFTPGRTYRIVADVVGGEPGWPVRNETTVEVLEAVAKPHMEVRPEREVFRQGENVSIEAILHNPGDEPYTYTSRDGCHDIHVWAEGAGPEGEDIRLYPDMEPYPCTQALTEFSIPPGGELRWVVQWDGSQDGTGGPPYVETGPHNIVALLDGRDEHPHGSAPVVIEEAE